jgi:hypothetical protein
MVVSQLDTIDLALMIHAWFLDASSHFTILAESCDTKNGSSHY